MWIILHHERQNASHDIEVSLYSSKKKLVKALENLYGHELKYEEFEVPPPESTWKLKLIKAVSNHETSTKNVGISPRLFNMVYKFMMFIMHDGIIEPVFNIHNLSVDIVFKDVVIKVEDDSLPISSLPKSVLVNDKKYLWSEINRIQVEIWEPSPEELMAAQINNIIEEGIYGSEGESWITIHQADPDTDMFVSKKEECMKWCKPPVQVLPPSLSYLPPSIPSIPYALPPRH